MISRRHLTAAAGLALARPGTAGTLPVPQAGHIGFRLMRNGSEIGSHTLDFTTQGEGLVVRVGIDIVVKFLGVPVYRYRHRATETWQSGTFAGIESRTDRDGTQRQMRAVRSAEGVVVEGSSAPRYVAPAVALPTTYWNRAMLAPRVINSEDGQLMNITLAEGPPETVRLASGATIAARRTRIGGELMLDIWYDEAGQWAHLAFTKDGSTIIYEKL